MEDIIARQAEIFESIKSIKSNFGKDSVSRKTPEYIKKRLEALDNLWGEFDYNNQQLARHEDQAHQYFKDNIYQITRELYESTRKLLQSHVVEPKPSTSKQSTTPPPKQPDHPDLLKLLSKQQTNFRAFQRVVKSINLSDITDKWEIEDEIRNLQSKWTIIETLHLDIDNITLGMNTEYENEFTTLEASYKYMKKSLNQKLSTNKFQQKSTPKLEIPTFTGNYTQWPTFYDLFNAAIHSNNMLTNAQKMQHLKGKIKGEAERLIHHLHISAENYETAWEILTHRYHNKQLLFTKQIEVMLNQPSVQRQTAYEIKKLHDITAECIHAIHNLEVDTNSWDPLIVHLISKKLDSQTFSDYKEAREQPRELPTLSEFMNFLENKFLALEPIHKKDKEPVSSKSSSDHQPRQQNARNFFNRTPTQYKAYSGKGNYQALASYTCKCPLCKQGHDLFKCRVFGNMSADNKLRTVEKLNICKNCLYKHYNNTCASTKRCKDCDSDHNTILHAAFERLPVSMNPTPLTTVPKPSNVNKAPLNVNYVTNNNEEILLTTILIKIKSNDGSFITLRALLDQGSQVSLISESAAQLLGLQRHKYHAAVSGVGAEAKSSKGLVSLECKSIHDDYQFCTQALIISRILNNLPGSSFRKQSWQHLQHIKLADPEYNLSRPIDILLDAGVYSDIIMSGLVKGSSQEPIAQQTKLGWILSGNVRTFNCNVVINNVSEISKYWEVEDISENSSTLSKEDQYCEDFYQATTKRLDTGRYEVALPMKPGFENQLGTSRPKANAQFNQLENKMEKNPVFATNYKRFMDEYQQLGHMVPVSTNNEPSYYLPHHGVEKLDSTTTKLRVVFNASSKSSSSKSLNDLMMRGPNLQSDLQALILKWRQYKYVLTADIEKAFRQLFIRESDRSLQTIIWRASKSEDIQEYNLVTVTYGTKAAPYLTMRTLRQLAKDDAEKFPLAAPELENSFFMDDLLTGENSIEKALSLQQQLIEILLGAGMNLRKWSSNDSKLLEKLSNDQLNAPFEFKNAETRKTLGLQWNPATDTFMFCNKFTDKDNATYTKRQVLSEISQIFDPLGWLSPITIRAKLFFQKVWTLNLSWDDQISYECKEEWCIIKQDLKQIDQFVIDRHLGNTENGITLHGFCDASEKAYACVIYLVSKDSKGKITSRLVAAKTKVSPLNKTVSLPRLELCGAVLLTQLIDKVCSSLSNLNIKIYAWTDSMVVLGWLKGDISRWKQFVANRVQKITTKIPPSNWHYVSTKENPADCASRGITSYQLSQHELWWSGPQFISDEKPISDTQEKYEVPTLEIKPANVNLALEQRPSFINELLTKHNSITRVVRITAWILRYIRRVRKISVSAKHLTCTEIDEAYQLITKAIQEQDFRNELEDLKNKGYVNKKSRLSSLNPYIDNCGILRVGGRLNNSIICNAAKHPIILTSYNLLTKLLIERAHKTTLHGGVKLTLSYLRDKYWILNGINTVKKQLRTCITCKRFSNQSRQQIMGDLPSARVTPSRPFTHTGVDFTGHVEIKANKGRGIKTLKGYIVVFVCLATKAVHLDLVSSLDTQSFLAAFRRFCSRRGTPLHVYSDNGTNFVGADRVLKAEYQQIIRTINQDLFDNLDSMDIEWHFNAPSWPSAGGLWEAAVKSTKYHLKRVIGNQKLTFEEFSTLLCQVEACLNSRPICTLSENVEDDFLTPGHFLVGGPLLSRPQTDSNNISIPQRWRLVQDMYKQFWKSWSREYLQHLQTRSKWRTPSLNMQVNDIVLIKDENIPPGKWAMGRVQEVHSGTDGYVRVVSIRSNNKIIKRPITKLILLPVYEGCPNKSHQKQLSEHTSPVKEQSIKKTGDRSKRNVVKSLFYTMLLLLTFISPSIGLPTNSTFNITLLEDKQQLYFDKITNLQIVKDDWKLVIFYNMTTYWQGISDIKEFVHHIESLCSRTNMNIIQYQSIATQLESQVNELDHYNYLLKFKDIKRQKRGLINGIGYLASELFGVLDYRFAKQYEHDIEKITVNENHLQDLLRNQTSVIEAEYNIIRRHEHIMDKQFNLIRSHLNNLTVHVNQIRQDNQEALYVTSLVLAANIIIENLNRIQRTLLDTVTDINNGRIDAHILSPEQLQHQIDTIAGQLRGDLTIPVDKAAVTNLYKLLKVYATITEKYLIIEMNIPIVSDEIYELDNIISIPQKIDQDMKLTIPSMPYISYNVRKDMALFLTYHDLQKCLEIPSKLICHLSRPIYNIKVEKSICNLKLVNTESNIEVSTCKSVTTTCKDNWIKLQHDNSWIFSCCEECSVRIMCPAGVTLKKLRRNGIITIAQDCTLKGQDFMIFGHNHFYNQINVEQRINIPEVSILNKFITYNDTDNFTQLRIDDEMYDQLKNQITSIKEQASKTLYVRDQHQYSIYGIYIIVIGIVIVIGSFIAWRRIKRHHESRRPLEQQAQGEPSPQPSAGSVAFSPSRSEVVMNVPSVSEKFLRKSCVNKSTSPAAPRLTRFRLDHV